jgi:hypothetical protein
MGESDFSLFAFRFRREPEPEVDRRSPTEPGEARANRTRGRDRDGGDGSTLGTVPLVGGALAVVAALAGGLWYAFRRRNRDSDDRGGDRVTAGRGLVADAPGGTATESESESGTASLIGLAFLVATSELVERYVLGDAAAEVPGPLGAADEVAVPTDQDGGW